jgi:sulfur carrier protein ThiS
VKVVIEASVVPLAGLPLGTSFEIPTGTSVRDLLRRGGIAGDELYLLPAVNGGSTNFDRVLRDGDRIKLYRLSAGG